MQDNKPYFLYSAAANVQTNLKHHLVQGLSTTNSIHAILVLHGLSVGYLPPENETVDSKLVGSINVHIYYY